MDIQDHGVTAMTTDTDGEYMERKLVGFMDEADNLHFQRWLGREYGDPERGEYERIEERDACQQAIYRLLGDDPTLLAGHSWPELRDMAGAR